MASETTERSSLQSAVREMILAYEQFDSLWRQRWSLSANEKLVVTYLWGRTEARPGELARWTGLSAAGITTLLDRLETAGYIQRRRDPIDRRQTIITLAEEYQHLPDPLGVVVQNAVEAVSDRCETSPEEICKASTHQLMMGTSDLRRSIVRRSEAG